MSGFVFHPEALADLEEIWEFIAAAIRTLRCWIQHGPLSGPSRPYLATQHPKSLGKSICTPYRKISAGRWRALKHSYLDPIGLKLLALGR